VRRGGIVVQFDLRRHGLIATRHVPISRLLVRLLAPLANLLVPNAPVDDPWARSSAELPTRAFGRGSVRDFRWYFERESDVRVTSIDEVCDWLLGCTYVSDRELFNEPDFWQHPGTFERLRQGDCEDHALWAWRKLVELGVDAELVAGRWDVTRDDAAHHAWVVYREGGTEFVLESVARSRAAMVRPLAEVRRQYRPHAAVNARFETTAFAGAILTMREERAARWRPERSPPALGRRSAGLAA
jgi:hypothetical protein